MTIKDQAEDLSKALKKSLMESMGLMEPFG